MKVLHVHSGNMYGGVETFLATLARCRHLAPTIEMSFALCFEGQIAAQLRTENVPVAILGDVRLRRPDSVWRARQAFERVLQEARPDAVVSHQSWPHAIFGPVAKSASVPVVLWMHMARTGHWLDRLAWRVVPDLIVCNSKFTASTLPVTHAPVEVVYYPGMLRATGTTSGGTRKTLDTSPADVVIIQVSRMEPLKGQRICLAALAQLRERQGWTCWQVGGAQRPAEVRYFNALREEAERLGIMGRVRFLGHRTDVPALLADADIYCQPNVQPDAFGISFVEAMAAGVPVVTSRLGGAPEVVDSTTGLLIEPGDSAGLAAALDRLLRDKIERERLGGNGPARALALCDPVRQMPRVAEVLESVGSGRLVTH